MVTQIEKDKEMKKLAITVLVLLMWVAAACSSAPSTSNGVQAAAPATVASGGAATSSANQSIATSAPNVTDTNAVSMEYQLLVGTFKLEGTSLAITKDQAAALLPLWKQVMDLTGGNNIGPGQSQTQGSATAAPQAAGGDTQAQIDALVQQIQAAMTAAQIQAIADLKITRATAQTIMQSQMTALGGQAQGTPPTGAGQAPRGGASGGNQPPQGTPPAGMGQNPQGTPQAGGAGGPGGNGGQAAGNQAGAPDQNGVVPSMWVNALTQLLQNLVSGVTTATPGG